MNIEKLKGEFSICSLSDFSEADLSRPFCFAARTDQEYSLVCPSDRVPEHTKKESRGWRAFRVQGTMELSLTGILAGISSILASEGLIFLWYQLMTQIIFWSKKTGRTRRRPWRQADGLSWSTKYKNPCDENQLKKVPHEIFCEEPFGGEFIG